MRTHFKLCCCILVALPCFGIAQVKEITTHVLKDKGFIEEIFPEDSTLTVNFVTKDAITREEVKINSSTAISKTEKTMLKKKVLPLSFKDLKTGMEITLEGEYSKSKNSNVAVKIDVAAIGAKNISDGRLDFIRDDYAWIDGHKVKFIGKEMTGKKKSGYDNKKFTSFRQLVLNDVADVDGDYSNGAFQATNIVIEPDMETAYDKAVSDYDRKDYEMFYPDWLDKSKRKTFFGKNIDGIGKVVNDEVLQEYVQSVGMKLIPPEIAAKKNFLFIVVNNPSVNANVRPNGLAYVNTGLLLLLENEAQLAAVLGHEISHVIYKHSAATEKKGWFSDIKDNVVGKVKEEVKDDTGMLDPMLNLSSTVFQSRISVYSVTQETQADRVGLSLMANAGYDPREAPLIWKKIYNSYARNYNPREELKTKMDMLKKLSLKDDEKDSDSKTKQKKSTGKIPGIMNSALGLTNEQLKGQSFKTHPGSDVRFEDLNGLIEMYWSDDAPLENAKVNEKQYLSKIKRLNKPEPKAAVKPSKPVAKKGK